MRIVVLSQWHSPEPGFKTRPLAAGLVGLGHTVTAITGFPNYPEGCLYPGYRQSFWKREEVDGYRVCRLPLFPDHSKSAVKRVLNYFSFAASASLLGPVLFGPADVMWVYHPPLTVGIPACFIGVLRGIPFVYEVLDMWPETLASTGMVRSPKILRLLSRLAAFIYRQASAITVPSPGFKSNLVAKGVPEKKIHVIPNWAEEEVYRPLPRDDRMAQLYGFEGRFNIVFGGNMGAAQKLGNVLEAAERLSHLEEIRFVFIGGGIEREELKSRALQRRLANVHFIPPQPDCRMASFYALADVLLVHLRKDPLFEITIPSKTVSYMACGRPVLAAVAGDGADVLRNAGAGLICRQEDPEDLAQSVLRLYRMTPAERQALGDAGRRAFLRQYSKSVLLRQYHQLFLSIAAGPQ